MNSHTPFDVSNDWTLDPYHCNQSNDPLVDKLIGNAYHVVRAVYCNLGNLKLLYDFLNSYGMVLGVKSEDELKKLNKLAKYARVYGFASTGDRQVTDYLYVPDDASGIKPEDPTATGSWIKVSTSGTGTGEGGKDTGSYIPYVYANGSALGGETSFKVPSEALGVPFLIINGSVQYIGYGFDFNPATSTITLSHPLAQGDEVIALTSAAPANPDNPDVPNWVQVNWLYNNGSAIGGEQVITVPYNFKDVPAVYKNGIRLYKNLQTDSYTFDPVSRTVTMTEILAQGDRVIVTIGGESATITITDRTVQEVARATNVKDSDVVLSSSTNIVISEKKVIYDVVAQRYWAVPDLPPNAYIVKVEGDKLTYNPGGVIVTLTEVSSPTDVLREELLDPQGSPLVSDKKVAMSAGGNLSDAINYVTVEQFGAKGDGTTNDTAAIQAAINYVNAAGGGTVMLASGSTYRASGLIMKPRVILEGASKESVVIKAPDGWNGNAVIMWEGYLTYKTDSVTAVTPGCFSAGLRRITIHGNKQNFGGTPSITSGNGVLAAGANLILEEIKIIYVPAVGLVTLDWGSNREQYQTVDPGRGWAHIGIIRNIRIQFCGNDCWHCEAQDYYLDDVEIVGAGDGYYSTVDTFSFWATQELVSNFRVWRNIDLGFFHSYGNYNGYGLVAGGDTSTFFIRIKYDSLILESCCIAGWFKASTYVQGSKLDFHEISQQKIVAKHGAAMFPPALVIECSNTCASNFGSIECVQTGGNTTIPDYSGVILYLAGQFNTIECLKISRSPTIAAGRRGTGVVIEGENNRISSGVLKGFFGTDNRGTASSCIVASSGYHYVNLSIGFANTGIRLVGGHLQGEIKNMGNLTTWQVGLDTETTHNRSMLKLYSDSGSNHGIVRGGAGAVSTTTTTVQTVRITGLVLPYVPAASEVTPHIVVDAYGGSSNPPRVDSLTYIAGMSSVNELVFMVRLTNTDSPMQATVGARLN